MKKYYLTCTIVFLNFFLLFSQSQEDKYLDSVYKDISKTKDHHSKTRKMLRVSSYWAYRDTAKALRTLKEADGLVGDDQALKGLSLIFKGLIYQSFDFEKAKKIYLEADSYLKNVQTKEAFLDRATLWSNLAAIEQAEGNEKEALKIFIEKCIPLGEKAGDTNRLALFQTSIGLILINFKEYDRAESYLNSALQSALKTNQEDDILYARIALAALFLQNGDLSKAKLNLNESEKIFKGRPESNNLSLQYYQFLSNYYFQTKNYAAGIVAANEGIRIAQLQNSPDINLIKAEKFKILKGQKKLSEAEHLMLEIIEDTQDFHPQGQINNFTEMALLQKEMGNFQKAYEYQVQAQKLSDAYTKEENTRNIQNLEAKYNSSEKERKLLAAETKSKQKSTIILFSTLLFLGVLGFILYANRQRKKRAKQELLTLEQSKNLEVANAVIEGEEQERSRIAKELHDGISGRLIGVKIQLENAKPENSYAEVQKNVPLIESILNEVRETARNLMPQALLSTGLENILREFLSNSQTEKTKITFQSFNLSSIADKNKQLNIYRIVQELVANAIRHGNASEIKVHADYVDQLLLIEVEDNGIGFDPTSVKRNLGLTNVETRVQSLNGVVTWNSEKGVGTTVNIECKL